MTGTGPEPDWPLLTCEKRWLTFSQVADPRPPVVHGGQPPAVVYFNRIETGQQRHKAA